MEDTDRKIRRKIIENLASDKPARSNTGIKILKYLTVAMIAGAAGFIGANLTTPMHTWSIFLDQPTNLVMGDMRATPVKLEQRFYIAHVIGVKLRDCPVKEGSFVGWAHEKAWRVTDFEFVDDPGSNTRRPTGFQDFGFWQWVIRPTDTAVKITLIHNCPDGEVHTEVGPFFIPRAIKIGEA